MKKPDISSFNFLIYCSGGALVVTSVNLVTGDPVDVLPLPVALAIFWTWPLFCAGQLLWLIQSNWRRWEKVVAGALLVAWAVSAFHVGQHLRAFAEPTGGWGPMILILWSGARLQVLTMLGSEDPRRDAYRRTAGPSASSAPSDENRDGS